MLKNKNYAISCKEFNKICITIEKCAIGSSVDRAKKFVYDYGLFAILWFYTLSLDNGTNLKLKTSKNYSAIRTERFWHNS